MKVILLDWKMIMIESKLCLICGDNNNEILFTEGRHNKKFNTVICKKCGFVFILDRMSEKDAREYYKTGGYRNNLKNNISKTDIEKRMKEEGKKKNKKKNKDRFLLIKEKFPKKLKQKGKVLDIGANLGYFLYYMKKIGWETIGVEPDNFHAQIAREYYGINMIVDMYEDVVFPEGHFDLIMMSHILEHCVNPRNFLKKINKDLNIDGLLFIEVPCIERPYKGNLKRFFWDAHLNYFSKNTLSALLKQEGFEIKYSGYKGSFLQLIAIKDFFIDKSIDYPCDDYKSVIKNTMKLYKKFKKKKK